MNYAKCEKADQGIDCRRKCDLGDINRKSFASFVGFRIYLYTCCSSCESNILEMSVLFSSIALVEGEI